jgi:hypothetical protein
LLVFALALAACHAESAAPPGESYPDLAFSLHDLGGPGAWLRVVAVDELSGQPLPARVVVTAVPPTPDPQLDVNAQGKPVMGEYGLPIAPGVLAAPEGVMLVVGDGAWRMPAGSYDLQVNCGPEWEDSEQRITIVDGQSQIVSAMLQHTVDARGWLSADLHVHTGRSFDSALPVTDRVVSEVVSGVAVMVTTDHNVLSDLQPDVERYGYQELARAIVGDEFNFYEGHGGAYPMPYDPTDPVAGGAAGFKLDWNSVKVIHSMQMFDWLHSFPTQPAVTVNHPYWPGADLGYFTNLGWSPPAPLADAGHFDAIEVLNGYLDLPEYNQVLMRYWFFLLNSGYRVTALGSSDTHRLRDVKAGYPRSWLRLPTDQPAQVQGADVADAIKHQRVVASNGPFMRFTVDGADIGDQVTNTSGVVTVEVTVDAPAWIDVDHVRLYVNGQQAQDFPVLPGARPRFHARFTQAVPPGDGWLSAEAGGSKPLPTALIGEHLSGAALPIALGNPVFLDGDGDGAWRPSIAQKDVGQVGPLDLPPPYRPPPIDCEPPLWANPAEWVNP